MTNTFLVDQINKIGGNILIDVANDIITLSKTVNLLPYKELVRKYYITTKINMNNIQIMGEVEEKNIEYKLKLNNNNTTTRILSLGTQMHWRLNEGNGVCHYLLGVSDDGKLDGIDINCLADSIRILYNVTTANKAHIHNITIIEIQNEPELMKINGGHLIENKSIYLASIDIFLDKMTYNFSELRVAVIGSSSSGKSTLISVLVTGELDDGYGSARMGRFRHFHEEISGETSSPVTDVIGIDSMNSLQNYSSQLTMGCIVESSSRIVAFIDLAGNPKYIRTTLLGITSNHPHFCLLVIEGSSLDPLDSTSVNHLKFAISLEISILIVINKIDKCGNTLSLDNIKFMIRNYLIGYNLHCIVINDDNLIEASNIDYDTRIVKIFETSCTNGYGIDIVTRYFTTLNYDQIQHKIMLSMHHTNAFNIKRILPLYHEKCVFQIRNTFKLCEYNQLVVDGIVVSGYFIEKSTVFLGPMDKLGTFITVDIVSIERYRSTSKTANCYQDAGIRLNIDYNIKIPRQGCFLIDKLNDVQISNSFVCRLYTNDQNITIRSGFKGIIHCMNIMRPVVITCVRDIFKDKHLHAISAIVILKFEHDVKQVMVGECFVLNNPKCHYIKGRILHTMPT